MIKIFTFAKRNRDLSKMKTTPSIQKINAITIRPIPISKRVSMFYITTYSDSLQNNPLYIKLKFSFEIKITKIYYTSYEVNIIT